MTRLRDESAFTDPYGEDEYEQIEGTWVASTAAAIGFRPACRAGGDALPDPVWISRGHGRLADGYTEERLKKGQRVVFEIAEWLVDKEGLS